MYELQLFNKTIVRSITGHILGLSEDLTYDNNKNHQIRSTKLSDNSKVTFHTCVCYFFLLQNVKKGLKV